MSLNYLLGHRCQIEKRFPHQRHNRGQTNRARHRIAIFWVKTHLAVRIWTSCSTAIVRPFFSGKVLPTSNVSSCTISVRMPSTTWSCAMGCPVNSSPSAICASIGFPQTGQRWKNLDLLPRLHHNLITPGGTCQELIHCLVLGVLDDSIQDHVKVHRFSTPFWSQAPIWQRNFDLHVFFHEYGRRVGMVPRSSLKGGKVSRMVEKMTRTPTTTQQKPTQTKHPSPQAETPPSCSLSSTLGETCETETNGN